MSSSEIYSLASESDVLAQDINAKLDDPDYVFADSAASSIAQLLALAKRCNALGLRPAARRLEQLAREVRERG